jgi:hypothetical protein
MLLNNDLKKKCRRKQSYVEQRGTWNNVVKLQGVESVIMRNYV